MPRLFAIACITVLLLPPVGAFAQNGVRRAEARAARRAAKAQADDTPIERWNRMPPEERRRALAKLPPERRREIQEKLRRFRSLPPEERRQLRERYRTFSELPPDRQDRARVLFRKFSSLPEDRRPAVRREFRQLRSMTPDQRNARMNSEDFKARFSPGERQMLHDLAQTFGASP